MSQTDDTERTDGRKVLLVVDDEPDFRLMVRLGLERAGYQVLQAGSGEEALELLRRHRVDVAVLDVRLPGVDGWEVLRRIRSSPGKGRLPVVVSSADDTARRRGADAGFADVTFLSKPFTVAALTQVVADELET